MSADKIGEKKRCEENGDVWRAAANKCGTKTEKEKCEDSGGHWAHYFDFAANSWSDQETCKMRAACKDDTDKTHTCNHPAIKDNTGARCATDPCGAADFGGADKICCMDPNRRLSGGGGSATAKRNRLKVHRLQAPKLLTFIGDYLELSEKTFEQCDKVTTLNLGDVTWVEPTTEMFNTMPDLINVHVECGSQLKRMPSFGNATALKNLLFSYCEIEEVTGNFQKIVALNSLDLHNNNLTQIPSLEKNTALTALRLSHNRLEQIPSLEKNTALTAIQVQGNRITQLAGLERLAALTSLEIGQNRITQLPGLEQLAALTSLEIGQNRITNIPSFGKITGLTRLSLRHNLLKRLPSLEKMTELTGLEANDNRLTQLPSLEKNTALTELMLRNNDLTQIPSLEKNTALTHMWLSYNNLTQIPSLEKNTALTELWLDHNRLTQIPSLKKNTNLKVLALEKNPLAQIPNLPQSITCDRDPGEYDFITKTSCNPT